MSATRWVTFWLIAVPAAFLLLATPAIAGVQPFQVRQYEQDFSVSSATAEENLELQERGSAIVGQLKAVLGKEYAGVWFDNQAGEFVIPLLPGTNQGTVSALLSDDGLGKAFRTTHAASSWTELEATQERIDGPLEKLIKDGLVQTSLDPRTNAVAIRQTQAIDKANEAALQRFASSEGTRTEIQSAGTEHFNFEPLACKTSSPRACGRPLRGGVSLTRNTGAFHESGECSVGFKATASGNRYILTAGHCAAVFSSWGSEDATGTFHQIGTVTAYTFPGGDWAKISANGSSYWDVAPWPSEVAHYWEDQERAIEYEGWSYLGDYVCHSGNRSGTSCGGASAINVTAPYGVNHLTEVKGVCALGGDSGGPVFEGHTALGLLSGGDPEYPECERPILYAEITEATNALGVNVGTRLGGAPTATTNPATNIQKNQATANGEVNPNSVETHYRFEYGTTTGYGSSLPVPDGTVGHGTGTVGVTLTLPNLQAGTSYHYRLVATSAAGTSYGADKQFTTLVSYRYMLGTSSGSTIASWTPVLTEMSKPKQLGVGDVTGDGKADVVAVESEGGGNYRYMLGTSKGSGISNWSYMLTGMSEPVKLAVGDFSGDGHDDVISVESQSKGNYRYMLGTGASGGISSWTQLLGGMSQPTFLTIGDVAGDGKDDVVAVESEGSEKYRYMLGTSKGTSISWGFTSLTGMSGPWNVGLGDETGDGKADIVAVENEGNGSFRYMRGTSTGSNFTWSTLLAGMSAPWGPTGMSIADVNADTKADIVSLESEGAGNYRIMFGLSTGTIIWPWSQAISGLRLQNPVATGDFTGDGKADVISVEEY